MSGITPILDTLLHQVLGRRDAPVDRPLPETLIAAPRPGQPAQTAHSDSRLDPRPLPASRTAIGGGKVSAAAASRAGVASPPEQGAATATRFSVAARVIANILSRFPASPSVIRPQAPLVLAAERTNVARLVLQLRDSIETSGLFYEAHLLRWRNGSLPLAQLLREPQMSWGARTPSPAQQPTPAATPSQGAAPAPTAASPVPAHAAAPANNVAGDAASTSPPTSTGTPQTYGVDGKPLPNLPVAGGGGSSHPVAPAGTQLLALAAHDQVVHAALEGVVRHQLEMLAAPVLRWEGAPWAGVFMALTLQPPQHPSAQERPGEEGRPRQDDDTPWQTHLTLRLSRLGEVKVNLQFGAQRVGLDLEAEPDAADRMNAASGTLRERLGALGFRQVVLRIRAHGRLEAGHD
ncbi:MAG TPA: flagellar hook-length control protein FliK [Rhodanobacteraceae bacterium]